MSNCVITVPPARFKRLKWLLLFALLLSVALCFTACKALLGLSEWVRISGTPWHGQPLTARSSSDLDGSFSWHYQSPGSNSWVNAPGYLGGHFFSTLTINEYFEIGGRIRASRYTDWDSSNWPRRRRIYSNTLTMYDLVYF